MAFLHRLSLTNFRNFRQADIRLPVGISVFYGPNAQGKTAILEAAYTLAVGRAFRAEREREVLNFHAARSGEAAYITGVAAEGDQTLTVVVGYQPTGPAPESEDELSDVSVAHHVLKQIRINRQSSPASGLVGRVGATLFVVDDLSLVLGSPSNRRRYLDVLISQAQRSYLHSLQRYQAALRSRNGLLRRQRYGDLDPDEMEYWEVQLAQTGVQIALSRSDTVSRLAELARHHHGELADLDQILDIRYCPNVIPHNDPADAEAEFRRALHNRAARERVTAVTATGPHRDDLNISVGGRDAHSFASRGEARTIALALRLAEADYLSETRGEDPIILLDDVFSEMDAQRRERVLRKAAAYRQTLITTTDVESVRSVLGNDATYFHVFDNSVTRED